MINKRNILLALIVFANNLTINFEVFCKRFAEIAKNLMLIANVNHSKDIAEPSKDNVTKSRAITQHAERADAYLT